MLNSPSDAIEKLGGPKAVSDQIGRPFTTVASWASRDAIPSRWWPKLVAMAELQGRQEVNYETLARAHERKAKRARAA